VSLIVGAAPDLGGKTAYRRPRRTTLLLNRAPPSWANVRDRLLFLTSRGRLRSPSPRWLLTHGRHPEAERIVDQIEAEVAVFFDQGLQLTTFFGVKPSDVGEFIIPFAITNFAGALILGHFFDVVGRKKMPAAISSAAS
jgi:hypothetical protein